MSNSLVYKYHPSNPAAQPFNSFVKKNLTKKRSWFHRNPPQNNRNTQG